MYTDRLLVGLHRRDKPPVARRRGIGVDDRQKIIPLLGGVARSDKQIMTG
jgi:hypothetical protein